MSSNARPSFGETSLSYCWNLIRVFAPNVMPAACAAAARSTATLANAVQVVDDGFQTRTQLVPSTLIETPSPLLWPTNFVGSELSSSSREAWLNERIGDATPARLTVQTASLSTEVPAVLTSMMSAFP